MKWDTIIELYADDAKMILPNGKKLPLRETIQANIVNNREKIKSVKIDVKEISSEITGPNSVIVTTNQLQTNNWSGNIYTFDYFDFFLLERTARSWKIKSYFISSNFPVIYAETIDKKYQRDNPPAIDKLGWTIKHGWAILYYEIERSKEAGITPEEAGIIMGKRFVQSWDKSKGFDGLTNGFLWNLTSLSTYIEVLERNEITLNVKFLSPVVYKFWNVTPEELFNFSQNIWIEIADYMGANCSQTSDGTYWIVTFNKK
ncbi:MAG: hypothetical protein WCZ46_13160 [Proteiniphilum sp.]